MLLPFQILFSLAGLGFQGDPESQVLTGGIYQQVSPSGKKLAFTRWMDWQPRAGGADWELDTSIVIRDLATGKEWKLPEKSKVLRWVDDDSLFLHTREVVHGETGALSPATPPLTGIAEPWRLTFSLDLHRKVMVAGDKGTLSLTLETGEEKTIALGQKLAWDPGGFISWAPDGKHFFFDLLFARRVGVVRSRIGVVDVGTGKVTYVGERAHPHSNWGLRMVESEESGAHFWDPSGNWFLFVVGRGDGEGEIHISNADGTWVRPLTDNGQSKWSPAFDHQGRRVAFAQAHWGGKDGSLSDSQVRVLDLLTGEEVGISPKREGTCRTIVWSPDGSRLFYSWQVEDKSYFSPTIYEAKLQPPKNAPPGAPMVSKTVRSEDDEILHALSSKNVAVIAWGSARVHGKATPELILALRGALGTCVQAKDPNGTVGVIGVIESLHARELAQDVVAALDVKGARQIAIDLISKWKIESAKEPLLAIANAALEGKFDFPRDAGPDIKEQVRREQLLAGVHATAALASMGELRGWSGLNQCAAHMERLVRCEAIELLAKIRDPQSVEILIDLVTDGTEVRYPPTGWQVGDAAERSLAALTGVTFARDHNRWREWWKEQGGKLPELKGTNKALEKLRREP